MYLELGHTKLDIFKASRRLTILCYQLTNDFPRDERFNITQQIRRAALSVYLNVSEGASRRSMAERNRFYEIARGSVIEIDAAFDVAVELGYTTRLKTTELGNEILRNFKQLSAMIKYNSSRQNA